MNAPGSINYKQLLPEYQQPAFDQLTGKLRELFAVRLLPNLAGIDLGVAVVALDIIIQTNHIRSLSFQKRRESFFIGYLAEGIDWKIKSTLKKILNITEKGCFEQLLDNVDLKKNESYSPRTIHSIVNNFESNVLPALISKKTNSEIITISRENISPSPLLKQAYERVMACPTYFAFPKIAQEFLTLLPQNKKWEQAIYDHFYHLLNVKYDLIFNDFEKVKLCKGIFSLHTPRRFEHCSIPDISEFLQLCSSLTFQGGEELLALYLQSLNNNHQATLNDRIKGLNALISKLNEGFPLFLTEWKKHGYAWSDIVQSKRVISPSSKQSQRPEGKPGPRINSVEKSKVIQNMNLKKDHLNKLFVRFKEDPTVNCPLSDPDLDLIKRQYRRIDQLCYKYWPLEFNQLMNTAHEIRLAAQKGPIQEEQRLVLITIGRLAIRKEFNILPYDTQILALLGLLARGKSWQAQVKTGEGKSVIVALWAFVMAMECRAADIITSARYLATRDHEKFANFFQKCGISTGHICFNRKLPQHFAPQILYGPAFDFEFAWMDDMLEGSKFYAERLKNPFVTRNFDVVCVDESDNLLIDTSRNGARKAFPSDISYDWVYAPILLFVQANKNQVKSNRRAAIPNLRTYIKQKINEQNQIDLNSLPDEKLETWIKSAYHALYELNEKTDYVIQARRKRGGGIKKTIQIVDLETGRISENSRWSNGIHEFLEVKHDIEVAKESLSPITLSHAVFYQFYRTISALTGTAERYQTKEIYQIDSFDVPPHRPLKRVDLPPIFAENDLSFQKMVADHTQRYIRAGRPVLILCPTITASEKLANILGKAQISYELLNEIQEESEHVVLSQAGLPGKATIATNAAGRGTDIILNDESLRNGGLHVMLTFYPASKRVQDQAIGRAGRQGQPGSSQMILSKEDPKIKELLDGTEIKLRDEQIIELLNKEREVMEKSQSSLHLACADLDRFLAVKTHQFFTSFQQWSNAVSQDVTLDGFAQKLSSYRSSFPGKNLDFSNLGGSDFALAEECKHLLMNKSEIITWKIFLKKLVERLKKKMIHEWTKTF